MCYRTSGTIFVILLHWNLLFAMALFVVVVVVARITLLRLIAERERERESERVRVRAHTQYSIFARYKLRFINMHIAFAVSAALLFCSLFISFLILIRIILFVALALCAPHVACELKAPVAE